MTRSTTSKTPSRTSSSPIPPWRRLEQLSVRAAAAAKKCKEEAEEEETKEQVHGTSMLLEASSSERPRQRPHPPPGPPPKTMIEQILQLDNEKSAEQLAREEALRWFEGRPVAKKRPRPPLPKEAPMTTTTTTTTTVVTTTKPAS